MHGEVEAGEKAKAPEERREYAEDPRGDVRRGKPVREAGEPAREDLIRPGEQGRDHDEHGQGQQRAGERLGACAAPLYPAECAEGLVPVREGRAEEEAHGLAHAARVAQRRAGAPGEREEGQHRAAEDEHEVHEPHAAAAREHAEDGQQPDADGKADAVTRPSARSCPKTAARRPR